MRADPNKAGQVVAVVLGGWHLIWSILIFLGWAQPLLNFSLWAHMVHVDIVLGPFDAAAAVTVIVIATVLGYCLGYVVATVWNKVHSR